MVLATSQRMATSSLGPQVPVEKQGSVIQSASHKHYEILENRKHSRDILLWHLSSLTLLREVPCSHKIFTDYDSNASLHGKNGRNPARDIAQLVKYLVEHS